MHKELIDFTSSVVKSLTKEPEMVSVQEFLGDDNSIMLEIIVHESDMGLIIGKGGKMANAIRTLIQAYCYLHEIKNVKINIDSF